MNLDLFKNKPASFYEPEGDISI